MISVDIYHIYKSYNHSCRFDVSMTIREAVSIAFNIVVSIAGSIVIIIVISTVVIIAVIIVVSNSARSSWTLKFLGRIL